MRPGVVIAIRPGQSVVRLATGEVVTARNGLNVRTPPQAQVLVTQTVRGWTVVARER